jgi:diaminopropionate ammonia-lyase
MKLATRHRIKMLELNAAITNFHNPNADCKLPYSIEQQEILSLAKAKEAIGSISMWPNYAVTPLHSLCSMAKEVDVASIWYKDESHRFEIKSFKALGGAYAVAVQLQNEVERRAGQRPSVLELLSGKWAAEVAEVTVSCATDGNHGRSVSWGAKMFGCGCVIYVHRTVSEGRAKAMEELGATVVRISGNYDASVRQADIDAKANKRILVSDTSYPGYMEIPKDVALGYTIMISELVKQLDGEIPSHVFLQGGVGGLAATVCGYFWELWGEQRPRVIIVEPEQANCLQMSARAGTPVVIEGDLETLMAGLACGEVSALAWEILKNGADDFMTLGEEAIPTTMRLLAHGYKSDPKIEAGESAVPGLAAALLARTTTDVCNALGLGADSKILVIGTEGATDLEVYNTLVPCIR